MNLTKISKRAIYQAAFFPLDLVAHHFCIYPTGCFCEQRYAGRLIILVPVRPAERRAGMNRDRKTRTG